MKTTPFYTNVWFFYLNFDFDKAINQCIKLQYDLSSTRISNVLGYHSPVFDCDNFNNKFSYIANEIIEPLEEVKLEIKKNFKLDQFWININQKHSYNKNHNHPGALLGSVLYLKTPNNCGDIVFENPFEMTGFPSFQGSYRIKPTQGLFLIFPAYLRHDVEQNLSEEDRISLAFNFNQC
jgi:uncharacterized protein (TIGR02466 family)